jgi:hypothetical protein
MGFYKKSAMIRDISSGVHPCDKERTIKYAITYVPELLQWIHELTNARIKYPNGVKR